MPQWIREFVWLGDKHLLVLDVVEVPDQASRPVAAALPDLPQIGERTISVTSRRLRRHGRTIACGRW